jgi:hypothetical protein
MCLGTHCKSQTSIELCHRLVAIPSVVPKAKVLAEQVAPDLPQEYQKIDFS